MKLFNCFHPKVIRNLYTGEFVTCKCGKCPACLNARVANWVTRLDLESASHKYTVFCTLTFNDQNVPQFLRLRPSDYEGIAYVNSDTSELIDLHDINENFTYEDKQYIYRTKVLNVLDKSDFQRFIKRLRYYFSTVDKQAKLCYYLCGEYGPTTFRPHGHLLLYFDSEKCASQIEVLLRKAWKHGICYDPHFVSGSASAYCAAYLNSVSQLPKVYLHKSIKPFVLFSKGRTLGSSYGSLSDDRRLFEEETTTFKRFDKPSHTFKDEVLWRSIRDRIFPRCPRFDRLSNTDRISIYRKIQEFPENLTARQVAERIKREYLDRHLDTSFARYLKEVCYKSVNSTRLIPDNTILQDYKSYPFLPSEYIEKPFNRLKTVTRVFCEDSLIRLCRILIRVRNYAKKFHVSISHYVNKITSYYDKLNYQRLKDDYKFQDTYFKTHPLSDFVLFDPSFCYAVKKTEYNLLSSAKKFILQLYNVPKKADDTFNLSFDIHRDYIEFVTMHNKIFHDLVKTKKTNDYVRSITDAEGRILQPLNI